jgi:hypothetical protein
MIASYLYRIAEEEQAAGRPLLTAIVVHKVHPRPSRGFLQAAQLVGYRRTTESDDAVWLRALIDVREYWRPKLSYADAEMRGVRNPDQIRERRSPGGRARGKYVALTQFLAASHESMQLSFASIDQLVGGLPPSARRYREWWANHAGNRHSNGWLDAGRRVESVDLARETVRFG